MSSRAWILLLTALLATAAPQTVRAQAAVNNPHGDLDVACETCHSAEGWTPADVGADFDHSEFGFALRGAHQHVDCMACHVDLRFATTGSECSDCHVDVHQGELGLDCERCHGSRSFIDLVDQRRMHREALFALTGAHAGAACESCHPPTSEGTLRYLGTDTECIACHQDDYLSVQDPDHVADGFLEDCSYCHSTRTFAGGFFNHERQLAGVPLICVECHRPEYDATTDPVHVDAGFPEDCAACHNTRTWYGARFDHFEFFPINSGKHREEWDACSDCHTVASDYSLYDCLNCHPHSDQRDTDDKHSGEDEYSYDSVACFDCHPRGRGE